MNGSCIFGFTEAETSGGFMKGKNMTIFELMTAALVATEAFHYFEIEGKEYYTIKDIVQDHGCREVSGYVVTEDHGIKLILKPIENKAPERAYQKTGDWIPVTDALPIPNEMVLVTCVAKNGNRLNCSPDNLVLLTKAEHAVLTRKGLATEDPELTRAGVNVVKLSMKIKELEE